MLSANHGSVGMVTRAAPKSNDPNTIGPFNERKWAGQRFHPVWPSYAFCHIYTVRGDTIRLISARKAESYERHDYWKNR